MCISGWAIASEEKNWKYRLSVYYAKPQDSGTFTCATPRGITNSISLQVVAVHCEAISVSAQHITLRVEGTRLGHNAIFQCPRGFIVNGTANLTCQASGKWSAPVPSCAPVRCPSLDAPGGLAEPHLKLEEHNSTYGGRAVFSCAWGYKLLGPPGIECELDGNWSGPLPKCVRTYKYIFFNIQAYKNIYFCSYTMSTAYSSSSWSSNTVGVCWYGWWKVCCWKFGTIRV